MLRLRDEIRFAHLAATLSMTAFDIRLASLSMTRLAY
jgi:hypothetical protein